MTGDRQTYRFSKSTSIVYSDNRRDCTLSNSDISILYRSFVLEVPTNGQSSKAKSFEDRNWGKSFVRDGLKGRIERVLSIDSDSFRFPLENTLKADFEDLSLGDGPLEDLCVERGVIGATKQSSNFLRVIHHMRNCLCHGNFKLLKNTNDEAVFVFEDRTTGRGTPNVTARMVIKKSTLISWAEILDSKLDGVSE